MSGILALKVETRKALTLWENSLMTDIKSLKNVYAGLGNSSVGLASMRA